MKPFGIFLMTVSWSTLALAKVSFITDSGGTSFQTTTDFADKQCEAGYVKQENGTCVQKTCEKCDIYYFDGTCSATYEPDAGKEVLGIVSSMPSWFKPANFGYIVYKSDGGVGTFYDAENYCKSFTPSYTGRPNYSQSTTLNSDPVCYPDSPTGVDLLVVSNSASYSVKRCIDNMKAIGGGFKNADYWLGTYGYYYPSTGTYDYTHAYTYNPVTGDIKEDIGKTSQRLSFRCLCPFVID